MKIMILFLTLILFSIISLAQTKDTVLTRKDSTKYYILENELNQAAYLLNQKNEEVIKIKAYMFDKQQALFVESRKLEALKRQKKNEKK